MSIVPRAKTLLLRTALKVPLLDGMLLNRWDSKNPDEPWRLPHPFDIEHGVLTSGMVPGAQISARMVTGYGAAQPSIIRQAIEQIPDRAAMSFIDLGCGKGRPCLVATEYEFHEILGVELAPALARIARRNAQVFGRRFPDRREIEIVTGDALTYDFPTGDFVIYLYNPFGETQVRHLVERLVSAFKDISASIFVIYHYPVWAKAVDASPFFTRHFSAQISYAPEEIGFGPDTSDEVIIWKMSDPSI